MKLILAFAFVVTVSMSDAVYQKRKFDSVGAVVEQHAAAIGGAEKPHLHKVIEVEAAKFEQTGESEKNPAMHAVETEGLKYQPEGRKARMEPQQLPLDDLTPAEIQKQYEESLKDLDKYGIAPGMEARVPKHRGPIPRGPFPEFPRKPAPGHM